MDASMNPMDVRNSWSQCALPVKTHEVIEATVAAQAMQFSSVNAVLALYFITRYLRYHTLAATAL
jgi:hypothetical protein